MDAVLGRMVAGVETPSPTRDIHVVFQLPHPHTDPGLMWDVELPGAGGDIALQDTANR